MQLNKVINACMFVGSKDKEGGAGAAAGAEAGSWGFAGESGALVNVI